MVNYVNLNFLNIHIFFCYFSYPMRILHIYRTYFPDKQGGIEEAIRNICIASERYGIESKVFALSTKPFPTQLQLGSCTISRSRSWFSPASCDIGGIDSFRNFVQCSKWADLIHFHYPWPFADILNFFSDSKKPRVLTYHSDIIKQKKIEIFYSPLRNLTFSSMNAIIATSPNYLISSPVLKKYIGNPKLKIIPLGISESRYMNISYKDESDILKSYNIHKGSYFLFLGVLRYYKGLHILIKAANSIRSTIVIAGMGPEYQNLLRQCKDLRLSNVIFVGVVNDLQKVTLLKNCISVILPSHLRSEAFGMVLVESAMNAKPMITCEIASGTSFVNIDNSTGLVVEPDNSEALASAANFLLDNPIITREFGTSARKRYEELFSEFSLGNLHHRLYCEIIENASL